MAGYDLSSEEGGEKAGSAVTELRGQGPSAELKAGPRLRGAFASRKHCQSGDVTRVSALAALFRTKNGVSVHSGGRGGLVRFVMGGSKSSE